MSRSIARQRVLWSGRRALKIPDIELLVDIEVETAKSRPIDRRSRQMAKGMYRGSDF